MLAAIARALRLTLVERDHLYRLADHTPPRSDTRSDYVSPGMQRVLDRLDAPAMVTNYLGEVLAQNPARVVSRRNFRSQKPTDLQVGLHKKSDHAPWRARPERMKMPRRNASLGRLAHHGEDEFPRRAKE